MESGKQSISLGGHRHCYIDTGSSKPALLLVHGISSSLDYYRQVIPLLEQSFRVLAIDLLGFGGSDKPKWKPYSLELYAALIREFLEKTSARDNGPVHAVGHSMGGKYLLATALDHPGTFDRLVLANTDGFVSLPGWARGISLPGVRHLLKPLFTHKTFVGRVLDSAFHDPASIDQATYRKILEVACDPEAFDTVMALNRNMFRLDMNRTGHRMRLQELKTPTLVIWGDSDRYIPPKFAGVVIRELPHSTLLVFERCGHSPMLEYPERFCEAVREFTLADQPPACRTP